MTKQRILIVADDAELRATLARWLMAAGYAVELAESLKRAREVVASTGIALALVAPDQLGGTGAEPARELGGQVEHVIVIEAPTDAAGARTGPPIAADGYISRPVSEPEVLAKVRSALGSAPIREAQARPQLLQFEGYTLDAGGRTCVDAKGQEVALTRAEFSLLLAFGQQAGRVLSRDELTHVVAGRGAEPEDRSVDVLISRLRRKIEPDPKIPRLIVTVPGEGYRFTAKPRVVVPTDPMTASPSFTAAAIRTRWKPSVRARRLGMGPKIRTPRKRGRRGRFPVDRVISQARAAGCARRRPRYGGLGMGSLEQSGSLATARRGDGADNLSRGGAARGGVQANGRGHAGRPLRLAHGRAIGDRFRRR